MELLDAYTERIKYSDGIYAISSKDLTLEQIHHLADQWFERFGNKKALVIMPDERDVYHADHFDFGSAFRMLKSGWAITTKDMATFYLYYDQNKMRIMEQILPEEIYEATEYVPDQDDLLKSNWTIYRRAGERP